MVPRWQEEMPELAGILDEGSDVLDDCTRVAEFREGTHLICSERGAESLVFPISGAFRVVWRGSDGCALRSELVRAGDPNVLIAACHICFGKRAVSVIAQTDVRAALVPRDAFETLISVSMSFRSAMILACARRITELSVIIEESLARRIDGQIAEMLARLDEPVCIDRERERLSVELGTPPEVVAQHLYEFERRGWIAMGPGVIELRDRAAISDYATAARVCHSSMSKGVPSWTPMSE